MSLPTLDTEAVHEKSAIASSSPTVNDDEVSNASNPSYLSTFQRINNRIENLAGLEARGIQRVLPEERQPASSAADLQVALLWFSANLSLNNLATGLFGPMVFGLGFLDSALLAVFGTILGACSTGYMAIWGPQSGNRTMVYEFFPFCLDGWSLTVGDTGRVALLLRLLARKDSNFS
jgi:hypothetical protein